MIWAILPLTACFLIFYVGTIRAWGHLSPIALFTFLQMLMALASFVLIDRDRRSEIIYGYLLLYCMLVFMGVSALILFAQSRQLVPARSRSSTPPLSWIFWLAIFVSIFVVIGYFVAIGYSAFIVGLRAALTGQGFNIAQLRMESYGGSRYFFPGYVNQFKNALLPALVVIMVTRWAETGVLRRRILPVALMSSIAVLGLIGTGQRHAFVIIVATLVVYIVRIDPRRSWRRIALLGAFSAAVVIASTIALGRQDLSTASGLSGKISTAIPQLISRILTGGPGSGVIGFAYIYENKGVQNGQDWLQGFLGILPGLQFRGSTIDSEIFDYRYGSLAGSSPLSLWGDIYYNFGWIGIAIAPWILAILICGITVAARDVRAESTIRALGISGVSVVTGLWISGSPLFLLNNGIVVYFALWAIGSRLVPEGARATRRPVIARRNRAGSSIGAVGPPVVLNSALRRPSAPSDFLDPLAHSEPPNAPRAG